MTTRPGPGSSGDRGPQAPDLGGPEAEELLRPAAEVAIEVARAGLRQQPPVEAPSRLRPVLAHAKVTKAALATVRRVVEDDPAFRDRVAAEAAARQVEERLGRAGALWLRRPPGWEAELTELIQRARSAAAARAEGAEERSAQRRLRHAEEARDRAERGAGDARRAAEDARAELQEERRQRRTADEAAARAARHAASLEEQLAAARRGIEAAAARLIEKAESEGRAVDALGVAEAERRELRAEVAGLRAALAEAAARADVAPPDTLSPPSQSSPRPPTPPAVEVDRAALGEAVAAASAAAVALGAALGRAAAALGPVEAERPGSNPEPDEPAGPAPVRRSATQPRWARPRDRSLRRRPAALPPFVHDDSAEAAEHLVGLPDVALLVDGYNATLSTWPDLPLPEQRRRLVDALAELAARTGARPEVVFDGADVVADRPAERSVRSLVKVSFTASDVEADDVLIARAHDRPLPVVVASDDRRVREGARAAGANVLGIEQLLAALRRSPPDRATQA